jgi:hypothetical protein
MKKYLLIFLIISFNLGCIKRVLIKTDYSLSIELGNVNNCESYFQVLGIESIDLKVDLQAFLYKCLINPDKCINYDKNIFKSIEFTNMVQYIYTSKHFLNFSIYDYEDRWRESYINLLLNCTDSLVVLKNCEYLLLENINDPIIYFFESDIHKLKNIDSYIFINKQNINNLSLIATSLHNNKDFVKRDFVLEVIKKIDLIQFKKLSNLYLNTKISYSFYMEYLFGGF